MKTPLRWEPMQDKGSQERWDRLLARFDAASVFQGAAWGRFKETEGWQAARFVARSGEETLAAAQVLTRSVPGGCLAWIPGGPQWGKALPEREVGSLVGDLMNCLARRLGKRLYVRCYLTVPASAQLAFQLSGSLRRAMVPINSGFTYRIDIAPDPEERLARMSKKHRYYTRKALAEPIRWRRLEGKRAVDEFVRLHREMGRGKEMPGLCEHPERIERLMACFDRRANVFAGAIDDTAIAACLLLRFGSEAFYFLAASGEAGRKRNAAYGLLHHVLERLAADRIEALDLGGADPRRARGVNHFKKGFGGTFVEYAGEWDWAPRPWQRAAANALIGIRERRR